LEIWGTLADFGYRPLNASPYVLIVIALFFACFWFLLGIVGYQAKEKSRISPIGILFLFDRLIPLYNIRREHYEIQAFYRWRVIQAFYRWLAKTLRTQPVGHRKAPARSQAEVMRYGPLKLSVVKAVETEARGAEICLDVMRLVGVLLAVFVAAAVNALVIK
jgi:hypothetical protein